MDSDFVGQTQPLQLGWCRVDDQTNLNGSNSRMIRTLQFFILIDVFRLIVGFRYEPADPCWMKVSQID